MRVFRPGCPRPARLHALSVRAMLVARCYEIPMPLPDDRNILKIGPPNPIAPVKVKAAYSAPLCRYSTV